MQEKENIEELFRDAFKNYEEPVRPELWSKVSSSINPAPVQPEIADLATNFSAGSGILGNVATWIAGAAIVVSSGIGVYYLVDRQSNKEIITVPASETANTSEKINLAEITEPATSENKAGALENHNKSQRSSNQPTTQTNSEVTGTDVIKNTGVSNQASPSNSSDKTSVAILNTPILNTAQPKTGITPVSIDKPNSQSSQNSDLNIDQIRAYPSKGKAPLIVDFSYNGDADKTEWIFGDGQSSTASSIVQHTFNTPGTYVVNLNVTDRAGRAEILTQMIYVEVDMDIKNIPNIFTPNNDGINDIFKFDAPDVNEIEVVIYDKSGKVIYKWNGTESGWNGKLKTGEPAPEGTYFYIIFATGENEQKNQQKGTITLKR